MSLVGKKCPEFSLPAYHDGKFTTVSDKDYKSKILVLVFYPYDFTFVCPTEITGFSDMAEAMEKENAYIVFASCDSKFSHRAWCEKEDGGISGNRLPMLSDTGGGLSQRLGLYIEEMGASQRATVIVDSGTVVYEAVHAASVGRSSEEVLRVVRALNFTKKHGVVCPLDWQPGSDGISPK